MALRAIRIGLGPVLMLGLFLTGSPLQMPARGGSEAVPDLSMAPLSDFRIEWVNGRRLLRFTAMMVNVGSGHFELRGARSSTSQPMRMNQVIYTSPSRGTVARSIPTSALAKYSGDGHNHWHVQEMMRYDLWGSSGTHRGAKVGFCFLDSDPHNLGLTGASGSPYYRGSWCSTDPAALNNRMGISIGWGDEYEWYLAWQWVDITGLPGGTYTIRSKVDPYGFFVEEDETNQCAYARVSWTNTSNAVTLLHRSAGCPNDWAQTAFAADVAWMYETGITVGCAPDLYCTYDTVRRDQMASFLSRAFDLPATTTDFYADDEGNKHETAINRLAAAGLTVGCGPDRFCPSGAVTRAQMASFLSRALELPATTTDFFTDDEGNRHEAAINRMAEAEITSGCGGTRFCPDGLVTRGQMAAFLHRALTP